ncbi:S6 family peptidase, partial [Serratia symbiotica]
STDSDIDFHLPRLNKVVTDAVPIEAVNKSEIRKGNASRYSWYARAWVVAGRVRSMTIKRGVLS